MIRDDVIEAIKAVWQESKDLLEDKEINEHDLAKKREALNDVGVLLNVDWSDIE